MRLIGIMRKRLLSFVTWVFICCIIFLVILKSVYCDTGCLNQEIHSLLNFKNHLHDSVGRLASWNIASINCCEWDGASCDGRTGHVVGVDVHNCSLNGEFRPALFFLSQLRDLESLNVGSDNFKGQPIPQELGLLKKLTHLNLSKAGFSGTIPLLLVWKVPTTHGLQISQPWNTFPLTESTSQRCLPHGDGQ